MKTIEGPDFSSFADALRRYESGSAEFFGTGCKIQGVQAMPNNTILHGLRHDIHRRGVAIDYRSGDDSLLIKPQAFTPGSRAREIGPCRNGHAVCRIEKTDLP